MVRQMWIGGLAAVMLMLGVDAFSADTALAADTSAAALGHTLTEFSAKDFRGKTWTQADFESSPILVVAVLGTECPLAKLYADRLQTLANEYQSKGVAFVGIAPNRQDSLTELAAFARLHHVEFPLLKDLNNVLADQLGAQRTPEVFVLDRTRTVRYRGRVDDQYAVGGKSRPLPSHQELKAAVDDLLAGRPVAVPKTEAVGCLIGRTRTPAENSAVTYAEHIAPLLNDRCVQCHRPGEIAPFSLTEYDEVVGWADMIVEVTRERRMPPWHADPHFGHFANENRLSDDQLQLIQTWVNAGAPEGDRTRKPALPQFTAGWQLPREPDLVVNMADKPFAVKATGEVRYQYFSVDSGLKEEMWMSAAEVIPGNRAVVHHVIVFAAAADGKLTDMDRQFVAAYVPGLRVASYPKGMAKKLPAHAKFIFQIHYTPNGTPQEDLTKIGFVFAKPDGITHEVRTISTVTRRLNIEPMKDDQRFTTNPVTAPVDLLLLSLSPHMHLRGKSFRYEVTWPNGKTETLLDVPHYDFNWQTAYRLSEPTIIPQGTRLVGYGSFDNSPKNLANPDASATVTWGDQSWEEMLIGYADVAVERGAISAADMRRSVTRDRITSETAAALFKQLDKNRDGKLDRNEVGERLQEQFDKVDEDQDGIVTAAELERNLPKLRRN